MSTKFELEKFTGDNDFGLWKMKMEAVLIKEGLALALKGESELPDTMTEAEKQDVLNKAKSSLILGLGDKVLREVKKEKTAAEIWNRFIHPISYGQYPKSMIHNVGDRLPSFTEKERDMVRGSIDYVGINHYSTSYAEDPIELPPRLYAGYEKDRRVIVHDDKVEEANGSNNNGRPWGMYKLLMHLKDNYGHYPIIVVENGTNDASDILFPYVLHDKARVDYYKGYVDAVKIAIDNGAKVIGYFAWSLLDNWEWSRGYTTRYGIVHVDLNDQKRYPKLSAYWFQQLLKEEKVKP